MANSNIGSSRLAAIAGASPCEPDGPVIFDIAGTIRPSVMVRCFGNGMRFAVPTRRLQQAHDKLPAYISFAGHLGRMLLSWSTVVRRQERQTSAHHR